MNNDTKGIVFNIQNYTVNDGPGIRTEFFMKGCTLRCRWCSNPESQRLQRELNIGFKCIGLKECGYCQKTCPEVDKGLFEFDRGYVIGVDRNKCTDCFKCVDMCFSNNLRVWGDEITVDEAMDILLRERESFERSGGGLTVSGGEALMQHEFVRELCKECQKAGIQTCVESALHVPGEWLEDVMPYADLMIADIKHMDSEIHRKYTGSGNKKTLDNLKRIVNAGVPLILRIPIIPGVNDDEDNLLKTADFINHELHGMILQLQLLRFRRLGEEKYLSLGQVYPMENFYAPERSEFEENIKKIEAFFRSKGIPATAGTTTKVPGFSK